MNKVLNLTYSSSLTNLCEVNSSFDSGILRIAYAGKNRNNSSIDKATFERCLKTIYNCPIVCSYDRETDSLGGHDMEVVRDGEGMLKIINTTTPVGCIPESAKTFWEEVVEEDGTTHEYLCVEALLWKRQEAYQKIKNDGCSFQSMEINVKDGKSIDGIYHIYDFEFTAFALIGVEPCFESASLEFSKQNFKQELNEMMNELKESFTNKVTTSQKEDDNKSLQNHSVKEGGNKTLEEKLDLIAKYGLIKDDLDFSIEDISTEDLIGELEKRVKDTEPNADPEPEDEPDNESGKFALESTFREELLRCLDSEKISEDWGEFCRYWFVDYDKEAKEIYCWDSSDGLLYGFSFIIDNDSVIIDFESKKRKKYEIVDFKEGDQQDEQKAPFMEIYEAMKEKLGDNADLKEKYQAATESIESMETELKDLRQFKVDTEAAVIASQKEEILAQFEDLSGFEEFEALKENVGNVDVESLKEKCFAIRGKNNTTKYAYANSKALKLKIEKSNTSSTEPYGGIFQKYGIGSK